MSEISSEVSSPGTFIRKSSGLVRTVSTFDTFYYNILQLALPIVFIMLAVWVFYPGASIETSFLIAFVPCLCVGITYALFAAIYPRSGAEYVPLSRGSHPLLGFLISFSNVAWEVIYVGIIPSLVGSMAFGPLLTVLGLQLGNESIINLGFWFDAPLGWFTVGLVVIASVSWLMYRGMATYFRFQRWLSTIGIIGFVALIIVLAMGALGTWDFQSQFDAYAGAGALEGVIAAVEADGIDMSPPFSMQQTLFLTIWAVFSLAFAVLSTSFSGEIKNVTRGQLIAIPLAQTFGLVLMVLVSWLARIVISQEALFSLGYLGLFAPEALPLPIYPWVSTLASLMVDNIFVTVLIMGGVSLLLVIIVAAVAVYATRGMLAWSIDGMAPEWLGKVSERYHTPVNAILVTAGVGVVFLAIYCFTDWLALISTQVAFGTAFVVTSIVGAIFPYRKREVYKASPAKFEVIGIPLMTITGVIGAVTMIYIVYRTLVDPIFGANTPLSKALTVGIFVLGSVWYFVARSIRKGEGVDMDARFDEIPIE